MAKITFRRGFKKETNELARDFRKELDLLAHDALCPWRLAEHLDIPLFKLSQFPSNGDLAYLHTLRGKKEFSAVVCFEGISAFIIYNDAHALTRQAADISHEIAHIVLGHPPKPPFDKHGSRDYDPVLEAEANWLGPALLISEEAALHIVSEGIPLTKASRIYRVSQSLIRMRLNVVGAHKRASRRLVA